MEQSGNDNDSVMEFDHFYTNNHIQILKTLLPYMDTGKHTLLPAIIKYMELQHTIKLIQDRVQPIPAIQSAGSRAVPALSTLYEAIRRYLTPAEDSRLRQLLELQQSLEQAKELQQMMELMKDMSEGGSAPDLSALAGMSGGDMDISDIMNLFQILK